MDNMEVVTTVANMEKSFYSARSLKVKSKNSVVLTDQKYNEIIAKVKEAKAKSSHKKPVDYWMMSKYDVESFT